MKLAEVLSEYEEHRVPSDSAKPRREGRPNEFFSRLLKLNEFWGDKWVSEVTGANCRAYASQYTESAARRQLEDLRAALKHYHKEGYLEYSPAVALPSKPKSRLRWLTRSDAAKLLWSAYRGGGVLPWHRQARELAAQGLHHAQIASRLGKHPMTVYSAINDPHDPTRRNRHIARFILIALYSGTRSAALCAASWDQFDFEAGIFYRKPEGEDEVANKRRTPVRLSDRLWSHLERWKMNGGPGPVHFNGQQVKSIKKAFGSCADRAGFTDVSPHVLRHTAATWLMQSGEVSLEDAAEFLGMTVETLKKHYYHHHPNYTRKAADAIASKPKAARSRKPVSAFVPVSAARVQQPCQSRPRHS